MTTREEQLAELEKQLGGIEEDLAKLAEFELEDVAVERRPLAKKKKPLMADEEDPDMDDDKDCKKAAAKDVAKVADETITIEGEVISKAAVGEAQFALIKKQAERIAKAEADIAKERDERVFAQLQKRADAEYAHVPGTTDERAAMLKALAAMDEPLRKSFEAVFAASEKLAKTAFDRIGTSGGKDPDVAKAASTFTSKVQDIKKRDNCSSTDAMAKARKEDPEGFKAYQESGAGN